MDEWPDFTKCSIPFPAGETRQCGGVEGNTQLLLASNTADFVVISLQRKVVLGGGDHNIELTRLFCENGFALGMSKKTAKSVFGSGSRHSHKQASKILAMCANGLLTWQGRTAEFPIKENFPIKSKMPASNEAGIFGISGGEGGIRTHGTLARTPDFESGTFDHSATSPGSKTGVSERPRL